MAIPIHPIRQRKDQGPGSMDLGSKEIEGCTDKSRITRNQSKNRASTDTRNSEEEYNKKPKESKPEARKVKRSELQSFKAFIDQDQALSTTSAMLSYNDDVGICTNSLPKEAQESQQG
ncbi:hypothetical protein Tco_0982712 [Tanacetum coccineum]